MMGYYKYLAVDTSHDNWGLQVLNAGCANVQPAEEYPAPTHPKHHYFNWERGRVLDNCYVVYIARGTGYFQSSHQAPIRIEEGTVMMLYPGQWHRYKPDEQSGWEEYWVGFNGSIMSDLVNKSYFHPKHPLMKIGVQEKMLQLFRDIIETVRIERPGYQALACGTIMHLLGSIHASAQNPNASPAETVTLINKAKLFIELHIEQSLTPEQIAAELNVSYAWFRKAFKATTGMAPKQYILHLKMQRATQLLADSAKTVKEIAYLLNFESAFYFSTLFKKKMGVSPDVFRSRQAAT